jgi:hypothetical protein
LILFTPLHEEKDPEKTDNISYPAGNFNDGRAFLVQGKNGLHQGLHPGVEDLV